MAELKKLNFVPEYGSKGYSVATSVYAGTKAKLPESLKAKIDGLEETVTEASAPYILKAHDKSTELLKIVDDQVRQTSKGVDQTKQICGF